MSEIHSAINWKPTFFLKPHSSLILAVEVSDSLYPQVLKIAGHDIKHYQFPIAVYIACPLVVYQSDKNQAVANQLKAHGFGIITVDDNGGCTIQHQCVALAQHITEKELDDLIRPLPPRVKVAFRNAYATYNANEGQGLQEAGQIVEALIKALASETARQGHASSLRGSAADTLDALYMLTAFEHDRAALGGAREFVKDFRNVASHAPRSAREAYGKIQRCRTGFLDGISIASKLCEIMRKKNMRIKIHVT